MLRQESSMDKDLRHRLLRKGLAEQLPARDMRRLLRHLKADKPVLLDGYIASNGVG